MPYLSLHTNCEVSAARKPKILRFLSKLVQTETSKPESSIMVTVYPNESILFAGEEMPAAFVEFKSIGLQETDTARISKAICLAVEQELGISSKRIYINFTNVNPRMWGWDKQTF
ncbi:MAG: phenylpyruvate tautomerase MIF-related protein [bacterium]